MDDEQLVDVLSRHLQGPASALELGAPYDDLVSGLVGGTLLDDERARALELLGAHPALQTLLAHVDRHAEPKASAQESMETGGGRSEATPVAARASRARWWVAAAAAAVLAAVLLTVVWNQDSEPATIDARMLASVRALSAEAPDLFKDFMPLTPEEREARQDDVERGALFLREPRGALLEGRPTFRWDGTIDEERCRVIVRDEDGSLVLDETTTRGHLTWPTGREALSPGGRFVWRVTVLDGSSLRQGSQAIRRLDEAAAERYRAGLARILAADTPEAHLLASHWAIRMDLLADAERHLAAAGKSDAAKSTRAWLRAARGQGRR